ALSMAERELVLSWPVVDERGNPTIVSPFVDEVTACLAGDVQAEVLDPTALVPPAERCNEAAELVARAVLERWSRRRDALPGRRADGLGVALPGGAARLASIDRRALSEERRSRYFLATDATVKEALADPWIGRLPAGDLLAARLAAMRWSPSRLDVLGACGF